VGGGGGGIKSIPVYVSLLGATFGSAETVVPSNSL